MNATDIVGYTYQAEVLCPECVIQALAGVPLGDEYTAEEALAFVAQHKGVNRMDEHSFDSGDFPKVVFADIADNVYREDGEMVCDKCGLGLVSGEYMAPRESLSSNHLSHDDQVANVVSALKGEADIAFKITFPEWGALIWSDSWVDTDASGVDVEYTSWVCDWLEQNTNVYWEDGEPWFPANDEGVKLTSEPTYTLKQVRNTWLDWPEDATFKMVSNAEAVKS